METKYDMDVLHGSDLRMPSGLEVESATFHTPIIPANTGHQLPAADHSNMKHKLDDLKSMAMDKMQTIQSVMSERGSVLKQQMTERGTMLKDQVTERSNVLKQQLSEKISTTSVQVCNASTDAMTNMQHDMRVNPMKWAGIAGASGMALGLIGRYMHWRAKRRMPQLIIIDAC